jgi:mono/diheme cytochrome c family protein
LLAVGILGSLTALGFAQADVGRTEYILRCGSCHGIDGKGSGPVAETLRRRPPDLTLLAKNNGGVFPGDVLFRIIDGRKTLRAHGNYEMPVWGGNVSPDRISAINNYLRSLQAK